MNKTNDEWVTYCEAGVDMVKEQLSVKNILGEIKKCDALRINKPGEKIIGIGLFASVIKIGSNKGLALCTDGVGTKILIAQMMNNYSTIGIDCVAMNVNDLICVGAEPISMVDYLAMEYANPERAKEIGKGLKEGCIQANITLAGGEIASQGDILKGVEKGEGTELVGMAVGLVDIDKLINNQKIVSGDRVVALRSSGVHSNGITMARKCLLNHFNIDDWHDDLGNTIGDELLTPTKIYVKEVLEIMKKAEIHGLSHITSWGLSNLNRIGKANKMGFLIDNLPEPNPIFKLIQKYGPVTDEEMYKTFNMGLGFCIVAPEEEVEKIIRIAEKFKAKPIVIGEAIKDIQSKVYLKEKKLAIKGGKIS